MVNKVGLDFEDFGGNVDVVIVKEVKDSLENSDYLSALQGDWHCDQAPGQIWSFCHGKTYPTADFTALAKALSTEFSTKAIYFYYGDASGWMGYQLFIDGEASEDYSFGVDYDEEMAEAGIDVSAQRKAGTVVAHDDDGYQCLFWSLLRTKKQAEIVGGEAFINEFLQGENAYIGSNLLTNE
ncbi:MAG: hypothetical protein AAGD09_20885 [Cyanobacteria bacterium P01_F01_bin.56]